METMKKDLLAAAATLDDEYGHTRLLIRKIYKDLRFYSKILGM